MFGFWYWLPVALIALCMTLILLGYISYVLFVVLYGEEVRLMIINLPGYTPKWFKFIDFSKPTKPWDIIGVFFFVDRIMVAVFTKKSSLVTDQFRNMLPKKMITHLRYIRYIALIAIILLLVSVGIFHLQQHGFLN